MKPDAPKRKDGTPDPVKVELDCYGMHPVPAVAEYKSILTLEDGKKVDNVLEVVRFLSAELNFWISKTRISQGLSPLSASVSLISTCTIRSWVSWSLLGISSSPASTSGIQLFTKIRNLSQLASNSRKVSVQQPEFVCLVGTRAA
jgi:hypothetical protein